MSVNNKKFAISVASLSANIFLILGTIILSIYLIAPMLGGEFFPYAILKFVSWLGIAFIIRFELSRIKKELRMRLFDYIAIALILFLNILLWFKFPINLLFGTICTIGLIFSFIKQRKWKKMNNKKFN